jgi:Tfp pilus assembly protein PilF
VDQALRIDPNLPSAHETALEIYQKMGKTAEAQKEMQFLRSLATKP